MKTSSKRFYLDIMAGNDGVTPTCLLTSIHYPNESETRRILIDCGIEQGERTSFEEEFEFNSKLYFNPESIETTILTHPHADHTGKLPILVTKGYSGKIHLTKNASKVMPAILKDNYQISKRKAKKLKVEIPFSLDDLEHVDSILTTQPFNETIDLGGGLKFTFFMNGHLVGAAIVLIQVSCDGYDDINVLFTGDYKSTNPFFEVTDLPDWVKELPLTVVTESTYGIEDSTDTGNEEVFEKNLLAAVNDGKEFIIPSCALERAQIILYRIKCLQEKGELSTEIPILIDGGLAIQHTMTYHNQMELSPEVINNILPQNVTFIAKKERNKYLSSFTPKIVVASGGMGSFGSARLWISSRLSCKNAVIHFTCYLAEDSLGRALYEAADEDSVKFAGEEFVKKAEILFTSEFSAHAKANELISFLMQFKKLQHVIVTHGEPETKDQFSERIIKEVNVSSVLPISSMLFHRITTNGLIRTISTKFSYR